MVENSGGPGIWGLHLKNVLVGEHVSRVSVALISDDGCKTIIADHTGAVDADPAARINAT